PPGRRPGPRRPPAARAGGRPPPPRRRPRGARPARGVAGAGAAVRSSPASRRQEHAASLDVPDAARGEADGRQEIGGQEEERVERLVMRVAPPREPAAPPVFPCRRPLPSPTGPDAPDPQRPVVRGPPPLADPD